MLKGIAGGYECAAFLIRLYDEGAEGEAAHYAVPAGKEVGAGAGVEGIVANDCTRFCDLIREATVLGRVHHIEATGLYGDSASPGIKG